MIGVVAEASATAVSSWIWKLTRSLISCRNATSDSVVAWLEAHPEVEVVSRDRGGTYVDGATQGALLATQVGDRGHLLVRRIGEGRSLSEKGEVESKDLWGGGLPSGETSRGQ